MIIKKIRMLIKENKGKEGLQQSKSEMVKEIGNITKKKDKENNQYQEKEREIRRDKVFIKVFRANSIQNDQLNRYDIFEVPVLRSTTVLSALMYIKEHLDSSLCIRYSCRMASCGSCGMKIDGIPRLACYTKVSELKGDTITCDPLSNFPHIRDLVTDFTQFFGHHKDMQPYFPNEYGTKTTSDNGMPSAAADDSINLSEFIQTPSDIDKFAQFSYCIKCGLCYSACPTVAMDTRFPGPQALAQAYRYFADSRDSTPRNDRLSIVDNKHGIWRCHFAGSCSKVCPKGVDPSLGIQLLRSQLLSFSKSEKKIAELRKRAANKSD